MNDLLGNDGGRWGGGQGGAQNPAYSGRGDVEEGFEVPPTEQELVMRQFFTSVEDIKGDMAEIRALQRDVMAMHERSKTIVKSKEMEKHRKDMQVSI